MAILVSVAIVIVFSILELSKNDWQFKTEGSQMVNTATFLSFFGYSVYMFEGIGVIIPIMVSSHPRKQLKTLLPSRGFSNWF